MITMSLGTDKVIAKLSKMAEQIQDFSIPFENIGLALLEYYSVEVFEKNGAQGEWAPLAPATVAARLRREGYYKNAPVAIDRTLVWTGIMRGSFYKVVTPAKLVIGNEDPKFAKHQLGAGRVPQRKMLTITQDVLDLIKNNIEAYAKTIV